MTKPREVLLGWRNSSPQAALAFFPPEPLDQTEFSTAAALFATHAPNTDIAKRTFMIRCPFNIRIRTGQNQNGQAGFRLISEPGSISESAFHGLVTPIEPTARRKPDVPVCQLAMNLFMISDEPCSIQLMPPFLSPGFRKWPGSIVCGRFPVQTWPRPLNAALEWHDTKSDWILKRGDPLAFVMPIYDDPNIYPRLVEAKLTPELKRHLQRIDDVSSYGRNVGPMFEEAERRRPMRLLVPKETAEAC